MAFSGIEVAKKKNKKAKVQVVASNPENEDMAPSVPKPQPK